jgi:hypothetical protein
MFGFDPISIGVGVLVWLAFKKQSGTQFGVMTAEREDAFRNAMAHCLDPAKLKMLADIFRKEGLKAEAYALQKRAEWRGRAEDVRAAHAAIFEKAMSSENAIAILSVAAAFEDMTATIKAKQLRDRAQLLNEQALKKQAEAKVEADKAVAEAAKAKAEASKPKPQAAEPVNGAAKHTETIPGNTAETAAE